MRATSPDELLFYSGPRALDGKRIVFPAAVTGQGMINRASIRRRGCGNVYSNCGRRHHDEVMGFQKGLARKRTLISEC